MQDQKSRETPGGRQRLRRFFTLNIRGKIVLPYLILTLIVAIIGTVVVITLVAGSLDERLTNQLLEAGRVVSDSLVGQEIDHLEAARAVALTQGLKEALQAGDRGQVVALAQGVATLQGLESFIIVDADGGQMLHMLQRDDGSFEILGEQFDISALWMVQALLEAGDPNGLPKRSLGVHPVNQRYYHFTAFPVELEGNVVGVVVVGTSLDTLLPRFKTTSLADVIVHLEGGRAIATTFAFPEQPAGVTALLDELSIPPEVYESALRGADTIFENVSIRGRDYRLARGPLQVASDKLGVFAVALPSNFIIQFRATSRDTYTLIFAVAAACVILVGYLVSRHITRPLDRLVRTSQAVAEGDLEQRTGIVSTDEIGVLAETFDEMTGKLAERTHALKELLQKHKETASRLQAILSSMGDGVLLEDLGGNFIPLNASAEALLKHMADNFMLGPLRELPSGDYGQVLDIEPSPWLLDHRRFQVGNVVTSVHSAAVRADDGERLGTVIVLRDVTVETETERLKDAFITHVSHELRTPLTAIKGYSELLLVVAGGTLDEDQRSFLEAISRNTEDLVSMINALLDFSELEAGGRLGLLKRPMQLSTLVEEVAEEWRPQMDKKGLAFEVETPDVLPAVAADARRLRWSIMHLVRNACHYTPTGGKVTVRMSARDGQVILDVEDTGVGISPEDQQKLFSRFYRVTNVPEDDVRGLGLGLYVTKAIVEAHGGEIRVDSKEGAGSKFSIILPALQNDQDGNDAAGGAAEGSE